MCSHCWYNICNRVAIPLTTIYIHYRMYQHKEDQKILPNLETITSIAGISPCTGVHIHLLYLNSPFNTANLH